MTSRLKQRISQTISLLATIAVAPLSVSAQFNTGQLSAGECQSILGLICSEAADFDFIGHFIFVAISGFLSLVGVVAFGVLVYCGTMYILSHGDEEVARHAKACMVYATIGIIVVGVSGIVVNSIINIAG